MYLNMALLEFKGSIGSGECWEFLGAQSAFIRFCHKKLILWLLRFLYIVDNPPDSVHKNSWFTGKFENKISDDKIFS